MKFTEFQEKPSITGYDDVHRAAFVRICMSRSLTKVPESDPENMLKSGPPEYLKFVRVGFVYCSGMLVSRQSEDLPLLH